MALVTHDCLFYPTESCLHSSDSQEDTAASPEPQFWSAIIIIRNISIGVFRESWYWFLHLILRLFNPCIWSVDSIIRSLVFFVCHLPFNLLIISVIDLQGLWTASYWPRQGLKEGGDATRGLFTRDYTSYEANGAIKYKDQYKESSQEVVDWYGILSLTDGGIFDFEKHAIPE